MYKYIYLTKILTVNKILYTNLPFCSWTAEVFCAIYNFLYCFLAKYVLIPEKKSWHPHESQIFNHENITLPYKKPNSNNLLTFWKKLTLTLQNEIKTHYIHAWILVTAFSLCHLSLWNRLMARNRRMVACIHVIFLLLCSYNLASCSTW